MTKIARQEMGLLIHVLSTLPTGNCPLCGQASDAIHSHYQRRPKDLPCAGEPVSLVLSVRKFFCRNQHCSRKIFTERIPAFAKPSAQMTIRLSQALAAIGLSTSGSLGARLSHRLGLTSSWMTILRRIMQDLPEPTEPKLPSAKEWRPARSRVHEKQHQSRLAENQARYASMMALQKLGIPRQEIARRLGVTVRTIQNWNRRGSCPGDRRRRKRRSLFDPYASYVLSRWKQGCKKGSVLYREIKEKGYRGTDRQVYRFLQTLKQERVELPEPSVLSRISVREALWLLARPFDELEPEERADLSALCQSSKQLATLHSLVQTFGQIVRKREGHCLGDWKQQVQLSNIAELQRFAKGLERDKEAVLAGLTEVYSNGMTEGFVNKLKLIKRQGYGRASFPLLRQRMLHAL